MHVDYIFTLDHSRYLYMCVLKSTVCASSLGVRSPLRLYSIRIDQVFVRDVQFEDTVPAIQV